MAPRTGFQAIAKGASPCRSGRPKRLWSTNGRRRVFTTVAGAIRPHWESSRDKLKAGAMLP